MFDVVIAGGGPVGLFLACELRLAGVSVVVLERMEDPRSPLKSRWMGMRGLSVASVEAFYRRGLLEAVRSSALGWINVGKDPGMEMKGQDEAAPAPRFAGHFAGIMLDANKLDFSGQQYAIQGPSTAGGMISLEALELQLAKRAVELGVDLRRGVTVTSFTEAENGITVHAGDEIFEAQWLVGCDGGRSTVRKLTGFSFEGTEPELTGYAASVELVDPEKLRPGFNLTPTGMYISGPGPDRIGMIDFDGATSDRSETPTLERLQDVLRRVSGTDVTIAAVLAATTYTDRAFQATTYRKGRVLLAGDAAHIHSPLGGQGLNTGIGDAMNLGWKLAATIQGWAPEALLDSYTDERHPVGAWVLNWTRAQVAIMRPDPHARAMASVVSDLIQTTQGATYFGEKISGISLRYNLGDDHPLVGRSAPDFEFEDGGTRLGDLLHDGKGLLLSLADGNEVHSLGQTRRDRLKYVSAKVKDNKGLAALLVRPDGFVAWAADAKAEEKIDANAAQLAVERWFGS